MPNSRPSALQWLELKLPPPLVAGLCALLAWWLSRHCAVLQLPLWPARLPLVGLLLLSGLLLDLSALATFLRLRTTASPFAPGRTRFIVHRGPYRLSRNPMYLGLLCLLSAFVVHLAHGLALLALPLFVLWITRFQIIPEERILAARFGESYAHYRAAVRRWL